MTCTFMHNKADVTFEEFSVLGYKNKIQGGPKNWPNFLYALTLPNINRFSKFFHCQNKEKICNKLSLKIPPHLNCVATLPCVLHHVAAFFLQGKDLLFKTFYLRVHLM